VRRGVVGITFTVFNGSKAMSERKTFVTDCDYCGDIGLCFEDAGMGTCCHRCEDEQQAADKSQQDTAESLSVFEESLKGHPLESFWRGSIGCSVQQDVAEGKGQTIRCK